MAKITIEKKSQKPRNVAMLYPHKPNNAVMEIVWTPKKLMLNSITFWEEFKMRDAAISEADMIIPTVKRLMPFSNFVSIF